MPFVLDASVAGSWALRDEQNPHADAARQRILSDHAVAPSLWWFEIRNIIVVKERMKRITEADSAIFLSWMVRLKVALEPLPESGEVLQLARKHELTVYDAVYLELARRNGIPLATLDKELTA